MSEVIGGILALASIAVLLVGAVAMFRPIKRIGLSSRLRAGAALAVGCVMFLSAGFLLPPAPPAEPSAPQEPTRSADPVEEVVERVKTPSPPPEQPVSLPAVVRPAPSEQPNQAAAILARIADRETLTAGVPNPPLMPCYGPDVRECEVNIVKFADEWPAAYSGDYASQRNVAYCLTHGCPGFRPDRVQGCAWRMIIFASADPEMSEGDVLNLEHECGRLSDAARLASQNHALRISNLINARSA